MVLIIYLVGLLICWLGTIRWAVARDQAMHLSEYNIFKKLVDSSGGPEVYRKIQSEDEKWGVRLTIFGLLILTFNTVLVALF